MAKKKILVIDDSSFQRKWLVKVVLALGHEAVQAANGREGLEKLVEEKPECITVDLNMPEMNGIEFLQELKNRELQTPTIVVTADISQIDLPDPKKSGVLRAIKILKNIKGIKFINLTGKDVVRHPLVKQIIDAYDSKKNET